MYVLWHIYSMPTRTRFDAALQSQFLAELAALWPALKGSLTEVAKPCIRPNCPACAKGDKHPAFLWTFTEAGRRRCLYVPAELVPRVRQGLENGRRLEARLTALGPAWLHAWRQQRDATKAKG
jgi:hypothetical protein